MTNLSNSTSSNNNVSISRPSQKQSSSTDEQTDKPETETNWKETKDEGVSIMPQEKNQSQKSIQTHHTNSNGAVKSQMDSKSTEHTERMAELRTKSNSPTEQVDSAIESNQQVICESCGFTDEDESSMSFWTGDSCPKCRKDYLVDITQR
jgi:RNA polymerase-binding transcription factor DksA